MHSKHNNGRSNIPMLAANNSRQSRGNGFGWGLTGGYSFANQNLNTWSEFGYPEQLDFSMHWNFFNRSGFAKAGVMRIVEKCWTENPSITDGEPDKKRKDKKRKDKTDFEKDIEYLIEKHALFETFFDADWMNRVGRYSGIIIGAKEQNETTPDKPMQNLMSVESIVNLIPVFESQLDTSKVQTVSDFNDPNYGLPTYYNYRSNVDGDRNPITTQDVQLDPSRVFIIAEGKSGNSIYGTPVNEAGFNSLMELHAVCSGGATTIKKNSKQRFIANINDNQVASVLSTDPKKKAAFDSQVDNFNKGGSPSLLVYGMDITSMQSQIADPTSPFNNSLNAYAASIGIPSTVIIGVQANKQATDTNDDAFNEAAMTRCNKVITPFITAFIKKLIDLGAVRPPNEKIVVTWPDLTEPSTAEKMDVGKKMGEINKSGRNSGIGPVYTPEEIRLATGYEPEPEGEIDFTEDDDLDENQ